MANRNYPNNKLYSFNVLPVAINAQILIGASGAVTSFTGKGINAVTLLKTGVYQIQLQDNYANLLGVGLDMQSPIGSAINVTSASSGTLYQIVSLGTSVAASNFPGLPSGLTPAVGMAYVASGAGTGTGTVAPITNSGISAVELASSSSSMLNNQPFNQGSGGYVVIQTLASTSSSVTTPIPANPASGSSILVQLLLNNSQVQ